MIGQVRPILLWAHKDLATKAEPETPLDSVAAQVLYDLEATMLKAKGLGLAACQIGHPTKRLMVVRDGLTGFVRKLANPVITSCSTDDVLTLDGKFFTDELSNLERSMAAKHARKVKSNLHGQVSWVP